MSDVTLLSSGDEMKLKLGSNEMDVKIRGCQVGVRYLLDCVLPSVLIYKQLIQEDSCTEIDLAEKKYGILEQMIS